MIVLSNVSFSYKKQKEILKDINLEIKPGEITMIVGKNGSGKSTLCSLLANILKAKGTILVDDKDIKKMDNISLRQKIGIVFQNPSYQIIFDKVYDDMKFVLDNLKLDNQEERIIKSLESMNILNLKDENPYEMSLGQKQRIALATWLSVSPKYLILDEVTSMIDYKGKKDIYNLLLKLKKDGKGIIFSTNIMEEVIYADKIVVLDKSKIKKIIKKDELLDNLDLLVNVGLEIPFILNILKLLKDKGIEIDSLTEEGILTLLKEHL